MTDLVGVHPVAEGHAAVAAAATVADLLRADANEVDTHGVTRARVDLAAGAGLLGLAGDPGLGGGGAPAAVVREVAELVAGACGNTWFVLTQHRSVMDAAAATDNGALRSRWAVPLASGDALGAVSFAHLRRPGPPTVRAKVVADGWRFDGRLDWVTSWGLADALLLMGETDDGLVVQTLLDLDGFADRPGVQVRGPLRLAAMAGSHTVAVDLEGLVVGDGEVVRVLPKDVWLAEDATRTPNAPPHAFGLARAVVSALHDRGVATGDDRVVELARGFAQEARTVRSAAYLLIDEVPATEQVDDRRELRAHAHDLALRCAAAYVTAVGGSAMTLTHDAQRWMREAAFHLVQAQTAETRAASLTLWLP